MEIVKYIAFVVVMTLVIWICAKIFADKISDYEIVEPEAGVKCIVVSRGFNTSVACWDAKD